jgi:hypothetical protein
MPRRSRASLSVVSGKLPSSRLQAPASLSDSERILFNQLVTSCDRKHFIESDLPLLVRYVQASCLADQAAQELRNGAVVDGKVSPWRIVLERCQRALGTLSLRLRLSPQARHRKSPGRPQPVSYYDLARDEDDGA